MTRVKSIGQGGAAQDNTVAWVTPHEGVSDVQALHVVLDRKAIALANERLLLLLGEL